MSNQTKSETSKQLTLMEFPNSDENLIPYSSRNPFQKGNAAEDLAKLTLQLFGFGCVKSSPGALYDLIADVFGELVKIQVKSTTLIAPKMKFEVRRSSPRHGPRKFDYNADSFHCMALVNIPDRKTLFFPGVERRIYVHRQQFLREGNELASWQNTLKTLSLIQDGGTV